MSMSDDVAYFSALSHPNLDDRATLKTRSLDTGCLFSGDQSPASATSFVCDCRKVAFPFGICFSLLLPLAS